MGGKTNEHMCIIYFSTVRCNEPLVAYTTGIEMKEMVYSFCGRAMRCRKPLLACTTVYGNIVAWPCRQGLSAYGFLPQFSIFPTRAEKGRRQTRFFDYLVLSLPSQPS